MAKGLVRGWFSITVYDLIQKTIEEMKTLGAIIASSSQGVAETNDVVISMVWDIPGTEVVIFGKNGMRYKFLNW
jgi:3-hydroxyisobutyrate dehydrogenase-like beta-hydroxyacid dehydrogenase